MSQINKDKYDHGPKSFGLSVRTCWVDSGDKTLPGPGQHQNVRFNKTNPPEWRLGACTERNTFLQKHHFPNPPPNNYEPIFQSTQTKSPNFSIPQASQQHQVKHIDQKNSLLYKPNYNAGKHQSPNYTMGHFQEMDYRTCAPAPNQYYRQSQKQFFNRQIQGQKRTQNSFSVSQRPEPYGQYAKFPGSGAYNIQDHRVTTHQYTIGKGQRPEVIIGRDAPGIYYDIAHNMAKAGQGKTIGILYSTSDKIKDDFPSPNKYTPLYVNNTKNIITTYGNRSPLQNIAVLKYPNPQKYSSQKDFYKKRSLSFTKDRRDKSYFNENPGPGTHNIMTQLGTKSGVMGKKLKENAKFITPGADHYQPKKQAVGTSSPRIINFYSSRVDFSKSLTGKQVGPGSYKIQKQTRSELGKISKSLKFPKQTNINPGPGSYCIPNGIGTLPQYYSGAKKLTKQGFSTLTLQMWQKIKKQQQRVQEVQNQIKQDQCLKNSQQN